RRRERRRAGPSAAPGEGPTDTRTDGSPQPPPRTLATVCAGHVGTRGHSGGPVGGAGTAAAAAAAATAGAGGALAGRRGLRGAGVWRAGALLRRGQRHSGALLQAAAARLPRQRGLVRPQALWAAYPASALRHRLLPAAHHLPQPTQETLGSHGGGDRSGRGWSATSKDVPALSLSSDLCSLVTVSQDGRRARSRRGERRLETAARGRGEQRLETERGHKQGKGEKQAPHQAKSLMRDSILGPQDHDLSRRQPLNQLSHPGVPR
uniref:Uncharacterized protein n=1 Tax=Mustela putorius furo TaxID=9669 RepID=M3XUY2_MUSPF